MPVLPHKLLIGVLLAASFVPAVHALTPVVPPDMAFAAMADEFFDNYYFPNNPTLATQTGIHKYDDKLEDYSRAQIDRQIAELKKYEARFAAFDPLPLSEMARGDRDLVLGNIRSTLLTLETIRPWEKNPDTYSSGITNSAFVIMERKFAPSAERLRLLVAREKQMPAALAAARANLKNPPKIFTEIALEQVPGLIEFFKNDVPAAFADVDDATAKKQFAEANAAVIKSLSDYAAWLKKDLLPKSNGDFKLGADTYAKKLQYDEMVDIPLDKLVEIDMTNLRANQAQFAKVAKELEPDKTPQQVLADLAADHPDPKKLLDTFRGTLDGLVKFIDAKQIIAIPSDVRPTLEETPPFMRATTFASMDTPGAYETQAKEAYFNVTLPESGWEKKRVDEFMAQFSYPVITVVAAHEAYPGHYVQFLWMQQIHDRVRKLLGANTNIEGWAHYCEQMMLDEGLAEALFPTDARRQKLLRLGQLQDALLRNARFIAGIKLHTGQFTFDQAVDFFVKEGYQSRGVGTVETKRGTGDPTYLYYTLGKLEILKLRADVAAKRGAAFNLKQFHDEFMQQGAAPIKIVRHALLGDDSPTL
ncbi:MAG: DUF885 domain-containing protein [Rudaea sp.]|uniref:DUF885 domain-containing protein n=1 Tax=unclassified Rudaea TaxID=2627037 RepID=UPI0010F4F14A|nr:MULTISPECIES: DUF885 domain-containing protein [unclassified Rudaea]MBN8887501.1 DUF885 domain-containing protein [Rudaea sp.]